MNPIVPIQKLSTPEELGVSGGSQAQPAGLPFQSLFQEAVDNVKQTDASLNDQVYQMTTGQSDNLHDIYIASQKASLSVDLLVQMRNKVLDSYNEIMRMSV
ncbi:flagellar hook-basal body complex protein FliE [Caproiciproducens sp. NJN-50]|uniref:flagellar hook-basal body complex protein FliE n=1 Tax=Acutalibacteraceae TaxID=3082771 RepID=UPI000FFE0000|nr:MULTISPECIES: flagellar hook-basal body complex protein FliE [Acutalibacteraceae]QAT50694.1 flagellar hook-basal body complex protein FliE [Caproiciproducens sp. NJN-50]